MPRLLQGTPISESERASHDRHDYRIVILVLGVLLVYAYLFTYVADILHIPRPRDLAAIAGIHIDHVFDPDRNVDSVFVISFNTDLQMQRREQGRWLSSNDNERLAFLIVLAAAFLGAYYLPLRFKTPALVGFTMLALGLLFGLRALGGLVLLHLIVFLVLHPNRFLSGPPLSFLNHPEIGPCARTLVVQSAIITVFTGAAGILLFFWQWERLTMYHVDYKDGLIPADVTLFQYLCVFFSPGTVSNWNWGVTIGQGYNYTHTTFYSRDKNLIILGGVKILAIALFYLVFWNAARDLLVGARSHRHSRFPRLQ